MRPLNLGLALLLAFSMLSCSDFKRVFAPIESHNPQIPADESSVEERLKIESTISHIAQVAAEFGYINTFEKIPIIVTTENAKKMRRWAYCQWNEKKDGLYIVINREVFLEDRQFPHLNFVFATLLHEIGHCYFQRKHENRLIQRVGYNVSAQIWDGQQNYEIVENGFPVSIMYVGKIRKCRSICKNSLHPFASVKEFQRYFVAELIGADVLMSYQDVNQFYSVYWTNKYSAP